MTATGRPRRRKGVDAVADAMAQAPAAVHLVMVDGIPRALLSPREFAAICGVRVERVREMIREGLIKVVDDFPTAEYRIPTSELARLQHDSHPLGGQRPA